ncbi:MAG: hypothetical protein R3B40_25865 [Polyangiales bacterium]
MARPNQSIPLLGQLADRIDNPIMNGIVAAGATTAIIASTTAFAPVGIVGAAGWTVVYGVGLATTAWDGLERYTCTGRHRPRA